jgi:hypothetical protein
MTVKALNKIRQETELKLVEAQTLFNEAFDDKHKKYYFGKISQLQNAIVYINSKIIIEQNQAILDKIEEIK